MATPFVTCDGCNENIAHRDTVQIVSTPQGFYFFHNDRDCYVRWRNEQVKAKLEGDRRTEHCVYHHTD
jgi:hypothetical protein